MLYMLVMQGLWVWLNVAKTRFCSEVGERFGHLLWVVHHEEEPDMLYAVGSVESAQYVNALLLSCLSMVDTYPLAFLPNACMTVWGFVLFAIMDDEGMSVWCWTGLFYGAYSIARPYLMEERTGREYGWAAEGMTLAQALTQPYALSRGPEAAGDAVAFKRLREDEARAGGEVALQEVAVAEDAAELLVTGYDEHVVPGHVLALE